MYIIRFAIIRVKKMLLRLGYTIKLFDLFMQI